MEAALEAAQDPLVPFQAPIDVELLLQSGSMWIAVGPDQVVWSAVANALGCQVRLLDQIMFGNEPVPRGESFDSIGMDDGGRLGVDYSLAVSFVIKPLPCPPDRWLAVQTAASYTHQLRRSRN